LTGTAVPGTIALVSVFFRVFPCSINVLRPKIVLKKHDVAA